MRIPFGFARRLACAIASAVLALGGAVAIAAPPLKVASSQDLADLSLDQLLNIEVTSVSRRAEPAFEAAAAIFVLTGEEIRRSGVRTVADALRLVPGMQVASNSAQGYIVTARGFTGGDKLEVLLDGRSVYTPLTSAVFWDVLDTYLPDVDRIEVIRGPGATLWGANAVNGVINIVTRSAQATAGVEAVAGGGYEEASFGAARGGWSFGPGGAVRAYVKADERDGSVMPDGGDNADGMVKLQAGARSDWQLGAGQQLTVSGDAYDAHMPTARSAFNPGSDDTEASGQNLLARWSWGGTGDTGGSVQAYYDGYDRTIPGVFAEERRTADLDAQVRSGFGPATLIYGLGYRNSHDTTGGPPLAIIFEPSGRTIETYSAFLQNQLDLAGGTVRVTLGSKFEHNDFTGFEAQPSIRLGWQAAPPLFTWAAVSRAVRTPNRIDQDIAIFCSAGVAPVLACTPGSVVPIGNRDFGSENLIAYEWGARWRAGDWFSTDLATYYNDYNELRSTEPGGVFGSFANGLRAVGYGAETAFTVHPATDWSTRAWYSWQLLNVSREPGAGDHTTPGTLEGSVPRHLAGLRASWLPRGDLSLDGDLRYVAQLPALHVPAYTELGLRVAWRPWPSLEVAAVGRNLLDAQHPEFGAATTNPPATELQRAGWLQVQWQWR